jgi:hypothetical protein
MQALERRPSEQKNNFRVKLKGKTGPGTPGNDPKSYAGSVEPITRYMSRYQNFKLQDNLKRVSREISDGHTGCLKIPSIL